MAPLRLAALAAVLFVPFTAQAQQYVRAIDPAGDPSLHDLDWRDGALWATDTGTDRIVRIDPATGAVSQPTPLAFDPRGLAWDGTAYRVSTGFDSSSPQIFTVAPDGTSPGSVPAPSALTNGLTHFDGRLFAAGAYPDEAAAIVGLNPATGAVEETIPFPSTQPTGLAFLTDGTLWASNAGDDSGSSGVYTLYHIDRATGAVLGTLDVPEGTTRPRGLAYDAATNRLYVTVRTLAVPQISLIYEIDLGTAGNAVAVVSPEALDFGSVPIGGSRTLPFTITNAGDGPLTIADISILWTLTGDSYGTTTLVAQTIAPGATITDSVTYHADSQWPVAGGGGLQFATNDVNRPTVHIPITGQSAYEGPVASIPSAYDFGAVTTEPDALTVAIYAMPVVNTGTEPVTVTAFETMDAAFTLYDADALPATLAPGTSRTLRVAFRPTVPGPYSTTGVLSGSFPVLQTIALTGQGVRPDSSTGGSLVWLHAVPGDGPSDDRKVAMLVAPGDLTGDGRADLVYASRTYATTALDANSLLETGSGPATLWTFSSCPDNNNCGAVSGNSQLYDTGLAAADLSGDGTPDLVIGTEGGNDHVYALDGRTGGLLWSVGSDTDPYLASYNSVSVRPGFDATGDGVPDVATGTGSASAPSPDPYNHRTVYLLSGADGAVVWSRSTPLPNFRTVLYRAADGLRVASGGSEDTQTGLTAWRAADGSVAWNVAPGVTPFLAEPVPAAACAGCEDLLVSGGATLVRINGGTGAAMWSTGGAGSAVWDVAVLDRAGQAPLVAFGGSGDNVRVVDATTGEPVWDANVGDQAFAVEAVPDTDHDGVADVLVAGKAGVALLLSGATGAERWRYDFGNGSFEASGEAAATVADLDGDGAPEVAVGTRDGRVLLLRGALAPVADTPAPGTPRPVLALDAPFPNPTAGAVTFRYRLGATAAVRLALVDALGRTVWTAVPGEQAPGSYALAGPTGLAAGAYTLRVDAGPSGAVQRLSVVR